MLLESAAAGVIVDHRRFAYAAIGPDLNIGESSDNFSSFLSTGGEGVQGRPLFKLIPELTEAANQLRGVLNNEQDEYTQRFLKRPQPDGGVRYLNLRIVNLEPVAGAAGLLLTVEDVTNLARLGRQLVQYDKTLNEARERLETAETEVAQLNQFKKYLLSMLAHDMRTPLAAIRGYAELLIRLLHTNQIADNPQKANAFADNICAITDQMTWLINDIMDLNQAEKGLLEMNLDRCDPHQIVRDAVEMLGSIIKLQNLTLTLDLEPPELTIVADPQRTRQIANNLIGSAIKFSPNGGEIVVRTFVEGETAVLQVTDQGKGLTAEAQEKLFQPYYRTKEAKASNVLGSGLGLSIVKILVEAQNGRVEVAGTAGKGNKFTVHLPLA